MRERAESQEAWMRRIGIIASGVAIFTMATALAALAVQRPADADQAEVVVEWSYDDEASELTWWLAPVGDEDPVDCPEMDVPDDDCHTVAISSHGDDGPNHGAFVSAFVHSLKDLDLDVPRGWLVRQVAQSDLGKGDDEDGGEAEEVEAEEIEAEAEVEHGRPDHAGRPDHTGPPDHAKDKAKHESGG